MTLPIPSSSRVSHASQLHRDARARLHFGALLLALLALYPLTGCRHHTTQQAAAPAYTPPPPIARSHPPRTPAPPPPPARAEDAEGKPVFTEIGLASWYGPPYHNRAGADGSIYDQNALTAAHRTLPMGSIARITNVATGDSVLVRITDRGPFVPGRALDLSLAAAKAIGVYRAGIAKVKIEAYAKPNADPEGRWCVQIGTFSSSHDADKLKNDLLRRYASARVIDFAGPTGYWVRINPAPADHITASHIANSIHVQDVEPYLVRLN